MTPENTALVAAVLGGLAGVAALVKALLDARHDSERIKMEEAAARREAKRAEAELSERIVASSRLEIDRLVDRLDRGRSEWESQRQRLLASLEAERAQRIECHRMLEQLREAQIATDQEIQKLKDRLESKGLPTNDT